jgi:ABC-type multidrug transport system fused ATPase/permease subunit
VDELFSHRYDISLVLVLDNRGVGRKLSDGVQFFVTVILGMVYGFWSSWQVSLLVLAVVPFMALSASALMKLATTQTVRANSSYAAAGSVVYTVRVWVSRVPANHSALMQSSTNSFLLSARGTDHFLDSHDPLAECC